MKKLIVWILAILLIYGCAQKKNEEKTLLGFGTQYALYPEYLKGRVKEMRETNYWAVEQGGKFTKGKPVTWTELDSIGSIKNVIVSFDESGNLVKHENIDENNIIRNGMKITYENGKSVRWDYFRGDTVYSYFKPEYDAAGLMSGGSSFRFGNDTLIRSQIHSNDSKGNCTKYEYFDHRKNRIGAQELVFNENGRVTEVRFKNSKDSLMQTFVQEYDDKGFMNVQKVVAANPVIWKTTALEYDEKGNCTLILNDVDNGKYKFIAERTYIYY